jgi:uncharacterized membrane protein
MDWILLSIASAFVFAIVIIADKLLLSTYLPNPRTLFFLFGIIQVVMATTILLIEPWHSNPSASILTIGTVSGVTWIAGLILMFYGISRLEVSRVIAIYHTYPVFVGVLAVVFLNEHLSVVAWLAILITICGAALVAMGQSHSEQNNGPLIIYGIVVIGSLLTAIANVTYKYALDGFEFWDINALRAFCAGLIFIIVGWHPKTISDLRSLSSSPIGVGIFVFAEILGAPAGMILMFAALSTGPVSLVSTLISIRPLFVLFIAGLLSTGYLNLLNEPITKNNMIGKLIPISMIVVGVTTLTMI